MKIKTFRIGGIHPDENKLSNDAVTQPAPLPKQAVFPMSQHIGAPAKPVVKKGDKVKVGTLIAEAGGFISAPIHSSVSGTVFKVDNAIHASGYLQPAIIINVEGDEWEETIDRSTKLETLEQHPELTPEEIDDMILEEQITSGEYDEEVSEYYFSNPDPYAKIESRPDDAPKRDIKFDESGNIVVKNPSAFWLPEVTIVDEIGNAEYTVTGSYEGTETLDKKLKRIMEQNAANDESDITEDGE